MTISKLMQQPVGTAIKASEPKALHNLTMAAKPAALQASWSNKSADSFDSYTGAQLSKGYSRRNDFSSSFSTPYRTTQTSQTTQTSPTTPTNQSNPTTPTNQTAPTNQANPASQTSAIARTGLGEEVDKLAALSPSLQKDLKQLEKDGWSFRYGLAGGGSYCSKGSKTITVDIGKAWNEEFVVATLAHEVGHATNENTPDGRTKTAFLNYSLDGEGAATLNHIKVQREIMANGGPQLILGGNSENHAKYYAAYEQYMLDGDAAKAHRVIGAIYGNGEVTSTTGQTYSQYYGGLFDQALAASR